MPKAALTRQRLFTLFLAALLGLFSPLAVQIGAGGRWLGVPVLYLYLFGLWGAAIALAAWIVSRGGD